MNEFVLLTGMMAATFSVRYATLALISRVSLPESVFRALRYVPVAVLSALIVPAMVLTDGRPDFGPDNAYLIAGLFCVGITAWKKHLLLTIVTGMIVFLGWRMLFA